MFSMAGHIKGGHRFHRFPCSNYFYLLANMPNLEPCMSRGDKGAEVPTYMIITCIILVNIPPDTASKSVGPHMSQAGLVSVAASS